MRRDMPTLLTVGRQYQQSPWQGDMRGDTGSLVGQRIFDRLHQELLPRSQQLLDRLLVASLWTIWRGTRETRGLQLLDHVAGVEEAHCARAPMSTKACLDSRHHPRHASFEDVADNPDLVRSGSTRISTTRSSSSSAARARWGPLSISKTLDNGRSEAKSGSGGELLPVDKSSEVYSQDQPGDDEVGPG